MIERENTRVNGPRNVAVIGGGVIGVATAYYLAKGGRAVTLYEQDTICSGCSEGNAGQITPGHLPLNQPGTLLRNLRWLARPTSPLFIPLRFDPALFGWLWRFQRACGSRQVEGATRVLGLLGRASRQLYEDLASERAFDYHLEGRLEICRTEASWGSARHDAELLDRLGFASQILSPSEAQAMEPAIVRPMAGAVYFSESGYCNPRQFVVGLAQAAVEQGAAIETHTRVTDLAWQGEGAVRLSTTEGEYQADAAVLACGSWTPRLARRLRLRLPVQPGKGYHLDVDIPLQHRPRLPLVLVDDRIFVTPIGDRLRLAGTMELSGFNLKQRAARLDALAAGAGRYLAEIDPDRIRERWCHLRPMPPDGLPIIGPVPGSPRIWIATGHGMLGLTQGPITGKLVAQGISGEVPEIDLAPLSPSRF